MKIYTFSKKEFWTRLVGAASLLLVTILMSLALVACSTDAVTTRSLESTSPVSTTTAASSGTDSNAQVATTVAATAAASVDNTGAVPTSGAVQQVSQPGPAAQAATQVSSDLTESNSVVDVVKKANPAVVTVYNRVKYSSVARNNRNNPAPVPPDGSNAFVVQGIGSGVIISPDGYIVTNNHVVDGQDNLTVALNDGKQTVPAKLIGQDKLGDIAVLKIDGPVPAYLNWASSAQVGETVVAIGAALGDFRNSVSKGVVSGLNRTLPAPGDSNVYIQTDAAINHGNSGGPLLNLRGEIVGINTAVLRSTGDSSLRGSSSDVAEGLGFAIPSAYAKLLSDELIKQGKVTRPFFGITYQMITPAEAGTLQANGQPVPAVEGAWIQKSSNNQSGVVKDGPADKAGLKDNDVITAVDGVALDDNNPLGNIILNHKPGDTIKLTVRRDSQTLTISLTLGERPAGQ